MPSLRKKPDGRYFIDDVTGGQRVRTALTLPGPRGAISVRDSGTAEALYMEYLDRVRPSIVASAELSADSPDATIADVVRYYEREFLPAKNAAPRTLAVIGKQLERFQDYCRLERIVRVSQVTPARVVEFSNALRRAGLHPNTIKHNLASLRAMFNAAVDGELIAEAPVRKFLMPKVDDSERRPLRAQELRALLALVRERGTPGLARIVTHMATTGNRPSDAVSLSWAHVDLATATVRRVSVKARALRQYPLTPEALMNLREARMATPGEARLVFLRDDGRPWTVNTVYRDFTRLVAREGFPRKVTLKDLRHTFGTLMANEPVSCPLPALQAMMGHSAVTMTMKYVLPTPADGAMGRFSGLLATEEKTA